MAYLVAGGLVLALSIYLANAFTKSNPAELARKIKLVGGIFLIPVCIFLVVTGRWLVAIPLAAVALSLFGVRGFSPFAGLRGLNLGGLGGDPFGASRGNQKSSVRSAFFEMALDHDSGEMDGRVRSGRYSGQRLSDLSMEDMKSLWREVSGDQDSLTLFETYLDSRFADWRVHFQSDSTSGHSQSSSSGSLTEEEAYEILGLSPGASTEEIRAAHRRLIKRVHPDSGGSAVLAAKLNEAKDRLLNRH
ncbi:MULTISPECIES: DnaJ domain-containing protein [Pseudovibrio]|uniref:DnaJ domain-containing protein n=1 Tax=Stappiaceae TaxID=2821832 RepID=UPI002366B600|nr:MULTISPECIES: DnaJ domain-containing protein [Pseudovibrio]MDD7910674.1 DnaJ domain-containing protein [Pseudovibrio exalbescens]MDX5594487.1 DnaJ domain-containing protein [Pseudovibrio sp. SPO723]